MLVSLSTNFNNIQKNQNTQPNQFVYNKINSEQKDSVSFGRLKMWPKLSSEYNLFDRTTKVVVENDVLHKKLITFINKVKIVLDNPSLSEKEALETVKALNHMPDALCEGVRFSILKLVKKIPDIYELKQSVIKNSVLQKIGNDNNGNRVKRDFFRKLIAEEHPLDKDFVREFKQLPDEGYKDFKEEIIHGLQLDNKNSWKVHWDKTHKSHEEQDAIISDLMNSLDRDVYSSFLNAPHLRVISSHKKSGIYNFYDKQI